MWRFFAKTAAEFLDVIEKKVLRVFPLLFTVTYANGFCSPPPLPLSKSGLLVCNTKIVHGNLKSENSQEYAQKPQRNCTLKNSASGHRHVLQFFKVLTFWLFLSWVYITICLNHWYRIVDGSSLSHRMFLQCITIRHAVSDACQEGLKVNYTVWFKSLAMTVFSVLYKPCWLGKGFSPDHTGHMQLYRILFLSIWWMQYFVLFFSLIITQPFVSKIL